MTKAVYLWNKTTTTRKEHICFWCMRSIKSWHRIKHDVWKEWSTVVNKYYCADCQSLLDTQLLLQTENGHPYNPVKGEIMQRYPQFFQYHFFDTYKIDKRLEVLQELQTIYLDKFECFKYQVARIFGLSKKFYWFDHKDFKEFGKTYRYTKHFAYFIFNK